MPNPSGPGNNASNHVRVHGEIETRLPKTFFDQYKAARNERGITEKVRFWIEVATLVFVIIYAGLTAWQAVESHKMAELTRKQLIIYQRPWLGIDLPASDKEEPVFVVEVGQPIKWKLKLKNYGTSPALKVSWHITQFIAEPKLIAWKRVQDIIEELRLPSTMQYAIFTGQEATVPGKTDLP